MSHDHSYTIKCRVKLKFGPPSYGQDNFTNCQDIKCNRYPLTSVNSDGKFLFTLAIKRIIKFLLKSTTLVDTYVGLSHVMWRGDSIVLSHRD